MFNKKTKTPDHKMVMVIKASDDAFIKEFSTNYQQEIIPEVIEKAKDDASSHAPSPETKSFIHTNFLTSRFNRAIIDYKTNSQNSQQYFHMKQEVEIFHRQKKRIAEKLEKTKNDLRIKERATQHLKSYREKIIQYNKVFPWIVILGCGEALFSATSLQLLMPSMLLALLVGGIFAVSLYFSALVGCKVLRKTTTQVQFGLVLALILTIVGTVFGILGHLRIEYLKTMADSQTDLGVSALEFAGIQLFFFAISLFLKINYLPEKVITEKYQLWKNAKKDLTKLTDEKANLERTLENLEQQVSTNMVTRRTLIASSKDVELKIDAMYRDAYEKYVQTNLHHRSDSRIPKCFENKDALPALTMYFQDDHLLEITQSAKTYEL